MKPLLLVLFEVERLLFRATMLFLCLHFLRATWLSRRVGAPPPPPLPGPALWPTVTVQLPVRNEFYVVERLLRASAALDYPRERLEIQVLDDSDDETVERIDALVDELQGAGAPFRVIRRMTKEGFKAGNLAHGLRSARGELVAIFDADFVPPPDFLLRLVPHFAASPEIGMVQGSWSFLNREHSLLTRAQGAMLDGLMQVEQPVRSQSGQPFQFNGTGGIWRRACIESAGGWRPGSVVEDLELSFQALMRGWRFVHRADVLIPTELPETLGALRSQQRRWAQGAAQALSQMGPRVARAPIPLADRMGMLVHLGRHLLYPFLALWILTLPLTTFRWVPSLIDHGPVENGLLFLLVIASIAGFLVRGQRLARVPLLSALIAVPLVIALYLALCFTLTLSFFSGLAQRSGTFVRTPKLGQLPTARGPRYTSPFDPFCLVESLGGLVYAGLALLAQQRAAGLYAAFFAAVALAFLALGLGSLAERLRACGAESGS